MKKQEFIKTLERMVEFYSNYENLFPGEYMVSAVERWAKGHPTKTRQTEFLKQFPNAQKDVKGLINICPGKLQVDFSCGPCDCDECRRAYWGKEIE